eukprot:812313-Pelagomonas_calceolata.AAC.1
MSREVVLREVEFREVVPCVLREVVDCLGAVIGVGVCHIDAATSKWVCVVGSGAGRGRRCAVEVCVDKFAEMAVVDLAVHREGVSRSTFVSQNVMYDV